MRSSQLDANMMNDKRKNQHTLPSRQLAQVFRFSASDLAANRAGFMSRAQEWGVPLWMRDRFGWVRDYLHFQPKRRRIAKHICGKIHIQQQLHEVHGGRFQIDWRSLTLAGHTERFPLSPAQYRLLSEGVTYHIYYDVQEGILLSLERAVEGCNP